MAEALANQKPEFRICLKAVISRLPTADREAQSRLICRALATSAELQTAGSLIGFVPMEDEPDIWPVLWQVWPNQPRVGLIRITGKQVVACEYLKTATELESLVGRRIQQPTVAAPLLDPRRLPGPIIVLVPGLAFSSGGDRLGRGQGWYDRFLLEWRTLRNDLVAIGVGFTEQLLTDIPHETHDQKLNAVCSGQGLVFF
jgi:5-formyltetrahydrofolate cyclo-ligase